MNNLIAIILAGGRGTRLGCLTNKTPKPLLKINNKKFLDYLIFDIARFGFKKIIIIAGHKGNQFLSYKNKTILDCKIDLYIEKKLDGTSGAIYKIKNKIKSDFFIFNGDTLFNFNYLDLLLLSKEIKGQKIYLSLRKKLCRHLKRYSSFKFLNKKLIPDKKKLNKTMLISSGITFCKKSILKNLNKVGNFEEYFEKKKITGKIYDQKFIDIGVPKDFYSAPNFIKKNLSKKAIFFDRDGVLNKINKGEYIINKNQYKWIKGAKEIIKFFNDNNYYVFIISNQAGIGKGFIKIKDYLGIESKIKEDLLKIGAHVDKIYFCPYHESAIIKKYRKKSFFRKPNPGMILKSLKEFPIIKSGSYFIGDNETDEIAAKKAGIKFLMFKKKNLFKFIKENIG
jgi:histidinol-phosphate phosphatase family protein